MRKIIEPQMKIGEIDIPSIQFDVRSRDEIPKILRGLQSVYKDPVTRKKLFEELERVVPENVDRSKGRRGMDLWKIFVLATLRLECNCDYDKLLELANEHFSLRLMLLHGKDDDFKYSLQTLKDNVSLLSDEVLDAINVIVVNHGHEVIGKKPDEELFGSCDSFPVLTDVHFPTDINLLWDAMRKVVTLVLVLCGGLGISGWRKGMCNLRKVKRLFRKAQNLKRSTSKYPKKKAERDRLVVEAHIAYLEFVRSLLDRARATIAEIPLTDATAFARVLEIQRFVDHAERQIDQISRRVVEGESIPHKEKIFSLFEEHTEWIVKGKAGVPVELGLNVCVVKDQFGFVLYSRVMQSETDDRVAVPMVVEVQKRFDNFRGCSFDKGFHSAFNQKRLGELLDKVVLPRKGRLSAVNKEIESSEEFVAARRKHSAVESSINALEQGGLDRCPDHGIRGFKRYIGLAVVARNLHTIGNILQKKESEREKRRMAQKRRVAA
jgi:transposase, IS5 family